MSVDPAPFLEDLASEIGSSVELGARIAADEIEDAILRLLQEMGARREAAGENQRATFLQTEAGLHMLLSLSRLVPALARRFASVSSYVVMSAGIAALREARTALEQAQHVELARRETRAAQKPDIRTSNE